LLFRAFYSFEFDHWFFPLFILMTMAFHLVKYEGGRDEAATDFAISMSGFFYIGLLGSFMLSLRDLPNGQWWLLLTLIAVWIADSGAFFFGKRFGKNKMAPRLSPKKSWQGYFSGLILATLSAPLFLSLCTRLGMPTTEYFSILNLSILAFSMALLPTLGDFGISMIKRQMAVKDSGTILPGHGGMLDRIDSWLWAFPISYFLITQFFLN
jgi:phosphatidate cytidylyltransferase